MLGDGHDAAHENQDHQDVGDDVPFRTEREEREGRTNTTHTRSSSSADIPLVAAQRDAGELARPRRGGRGCRRACIGRMRHLPSPLRRAMAAV